MADTLRDGRITELEFPNGITKDVEDIARVMEAIQNPNKYVILFTAPSVRAALGDEFGMPYGTRVTGRMVAALKKFAFDKVYDMNFGADLTIMEEANEFIERFTNKDRLPMLTSCCPAWIRYCEQRRPEFIKNLSSTRSPQSIMGGAIKSYHAERSGIAPEDIIVVSAVPCTVKKAEAIRPEITTNGVPSVDIVITTREVAAMIKLANIDFVSLPDEEFDEGLMKLYSEGGAIFGVTGGVMEAALRTAADVLEGKDVKRLEYHDVRGLKDIKESTLELGGQTVRVAVAHGIANAGRLLDAIEKGEANYDFVEIMNCSGGCVNGPGQPKVTADQKDKIDVRVERARALFEEGATLEYRKCHQNPDIIKMYEDYFGEPGSELAHKYLHTYYAGQSEPSH